LGDPDDRSLRRVEVDVVIPKMMKDEVKKFCDVEVKAFVDCSKQYGLLLPLMCRQQNKEMQKCTMKWYQDEEYRKVVTERYLQERSEFRRTGVPVHKYERGHSGH
ncbi:hypothetical protein HELRODRAFT_90227, partial [Helobdella robusta]|uniref:COX assembly mitochondrial protein n=1 Tax=Helobdella robusta TaxID=6412 RepID=T1G7M5_HELRO